MVGSKKLEKSVPMTTYAMASCSACDSWRTQRLAEKRGWCEGREGRRDATSHRVRKLTAAGVRPPRMADEDLASVDTTTSGRLPVFPNITAAIECLRNFGVGLMRAAFRWPRPKPTAMLRRRGRAEGQSSEELKLHSHGVFYCHQWFRERELPTRRPHLSATLTMMGHQCSRRLALRLPAIEVKLRQGMNTR